MSSNFLYIFKFNTNLCSSREDLLLNITSLWKEYPAPLTFSSKLFFIGQLAYWLHCYPELYFQRIKKEDIPPRVVQATIGLLFTLAAYVFKYDAKFF